MTVPTSLVRRTAAAALGALVALALHASAAAQEPGTDASVGAGVSTFGLGDWLGLAVRLALVVGVIWVAVAGMRWYVRRVHQGGRGGALGALEVLETHALGPNRTLHLVRLGDRAVLVGATPERITQLLTVDDPEELKRLADRPQEDAQGVTAGPGLASALASLGTGLRTMNARRRALNDRARAQEDARRSAGAPSVREAARPARFAGLRSALARAGAPRGVARPRRLEAAPAAETRQSLFERTLASIDAVEVRDDAPRARGGVQAAAGLRARTGYSQFGAGLSSASSAMPESAAGDSRNAKIADLQRAIAAARRNAG